MKKLLCAILIVVMMLSLVACSMRLSGTYKATSILGETSYEFKGKDVTVTTYAMGIKILELKGTYEINSDGDEITITYATEEEVEENEDVLSGTQTFKKGDGFIEIGGRKFDLQK